MKNKYVVVSTNSGTHGRNVLMSFAAKPLWKDYEEARRQEDPIPDCYDKQTAQYAAKKYGGEVWEYEKVLAEYEKYKQDFPQWQ